jgi:hypothetical protein
MTGRGRAIRTKSRPSIRSGPRMHHNGTQHRTNMNVSTDRFYGRPMGWFVRGPSFFLIATHVEMVAGGRQESANRRENNLRAGVRTASSTQGRGRARQ